MNYFVTAIDTDSGKTLVSSILCEALGADYWKPVQAGSPHDSESILPFISRERTTVFPEAYIFKTPASPHAAAKIEGVTIELAKFILPVTQRDLIIEGAGGCLVPLNETDFVIDIALRFKTPVILVADLYLGSINHTLLTLEALKKRNITVKGIIFNGEPNVESERIILHHAGLRCLLHLKREPVINKLIITKYANMLKENWNG